MTESVSMLLDGKRVTVPAGVTVMEAAQAHQVRIPGLCQFPGLSAVGACRLCIVEVKGVPRLLPACTTRVTENMDVTTASPKVTAYRRMILELLFAERNHICAVCVSNGHCELQELAASLGITHTRYAYRYPVLKVDASHRQFAFDANRCILCTRCVRACDEVEGARTWGVVGRGIRSTVASDLNEPWGQSQTCTSCSKCVHVCPTGALFEKGKAVGEMRKRENVLPYLTAMRASGR